MSIMDTPNLLIGPRLLHENNQGRRQSVDEEDGEPPRKIGKGFGSSPNSSRTVQLKPPPKKGPPVCVPHWA